MTTTKQPVPSHQFADSATSRAEKELLAFGTNRRTPAEELDRREIWWYDRCKQLKAQGYLLRPRYSPGWVPSWKDTKKSWAECEDGKRMTYAQVIDATRISDGKFVTLKRISKSVHAYEVDIALYFSSDALVSQPANHCVPIYEVVTLEDNPDIAILVMPLLRAYADPQFDTFGEVVDCFNQLFEGLLFMHQHRVAHRDCMSRNMMFDPNELYPDSFHPMKTVFKRDFSGLAKHFTRTQRPPKYYLIDFGLSRKYDPSETNPLEEPIWGGDKEVPEFQGSNAPCDPFPTDVFYIGNAFKQDFIQAKKGFEFMEPLVADMVQADPNKRPAMEEVVARFEKIQRGLSRSKLRSRVVDREEDTFQRITYTASHWIRRVAFTLKGISPIPTPVSRYLC